MQIDRQRDPLRFGDSFRLSNYMLGVNVSDAPGYLSSIIYWGLKARPS